MEIVLFKSAEGTKTSILQLEKWLLQNLLGQMVLYFQEDSLESEKLMPPNTLLKPVAGIREIYALRFGITARSYKQSKISNKWNKSSKNYGLMLKITFKYDSCSTFIMHFVSLPRYRIFIPRECNASLKELPSIGKRAWCKHSRTKLGSCYK